VENNIVYFKGRSIDFSAKVQVYRNLHGGFSSKYSIRQRGLVVAHCSSLELVEAEFYVSEAGRRRLLMSGRKNVHAWISGTIINNHGKLMVPVEKVTYQPRLYGSFIKYAVEGKSIKVVKVAEAGYVSVTSDGVYFG